MSPDPLRAGGVWGRDYCIEASAEFELILILSNNLIFYDHTIIILVELPNTI